MRRDFPLGLNLPQIVAVDAVTMSLIRTKITGRQTLLVDQLADGPLVHTALGCGFFLGQPFLG